MLSVRFSNEALLKRPGRNSSLFLQRSWKALFDQYLLPFHDIIGIRPTCTHLTGLLLIFYDKSCYVLLTSIGFRLILHSL